MSPAQRSNSASLIPSREEQGILPPFDELLGQPLAAAFLSATTQNSQNSQAYLFVGPAGAGQETAALLLAQTLLCPQGGTDNCLNCRRVQRENHPDLHILRPEGAHGYLAGQAQDLLRDVALAPRQSAHKVYLLLQADQLGTAFANAFLKVLEEPPGSVVFILISRSPDSLLPTIRSRCQIVPFNAIPTDQALELLVAETNRDRPELRLALAYGGGSLVAAREWLGSPAHQNLRRTTLDILRKLARADALDVLDYAKTLVVECKIPLDELKIRQDRELSSGQSSLSRAALTNLEQRLKREMTAAEKTSVRWALQYVRLWLRDLLLICCQAAPEAIVHQEELDSLYRSAARTSASDLMRGLDVVNEAARQLDYNVSVQSIWEFTLFTLREVLAGASAY